MSHAPSARGIDTAHFMLPSTDPALRLYLRNKALAGRSRFSGDRVVLFVHGATYPGETAFDIHLPGGSWMDLAAQHGFDTYLVDVRGYGLSDRPATMDQPAEHNPPFASTAQAVADVGTAVDFILQRRGIGQLLLVGWSWGTTLVAGYTTQHNERVRKLVLHAPLWLVQGATSPVAGEGHYRCVDAQAARQRSLRGIPAHRVQEISPQAWFEQWWADTLASDPGGAQRQPPVLRAPNGVVHDVARFWAQGQPTYEPAEIRVPTLLVVGEWDQDTPPAMAQAILARLHNAPSKQLVVLPEGTHAMVLETHRLVLIAQVQAFLAG
jgi:pimeloyl-ACP methyl ester carboxylesterase